VLIAGAFRSLKKVLNMRLLAGPCRRCSCAPDSVILQEQVKQLFQTNAVRLIAVVFPVAAFGPRNQKCR
jgi:hypothetical protein